MTQGLVVSTTTESPFLRDPDVQLMLRVQDGDDDAFGELVVNYQDRALRTISSSNRRPMSLFHSGIAVI